MNYGIQKPPLGSQISRGHPLAAGMVGCWLMNEGAGRAITNISANKPAAISTNAVWKQSGTGAGIGGFSTAGVATGVTTAFGDFACMCIFTDLVSTAYERLVDKIYTNGFWLGRGGDGFYGGGCFQSAPPYGVFGPTLALGQKHTLVGSRRNGIWSVYGNGTFFGSASVVTNALSTSDLIIGSTGTGNETDATIHTVMLWSRALAFSEVTDLQASPYAMFARPSLRSYASSFVPAPYYYMAGVA